MDKLQVYHFHNGSGGGVLSVIKNLIKFSDSPNIENHIIHAVNKFLIPNFIIEPIEGAKTQQLFYYSSQNNFYFTCNRLAKLLPNDKAIIIAHDWLELGMISNLGMQNPVVQILHGNYDYYHNLAYTHKEYVNRFLCVADVIKHKLEIKLPDRISDIYSILLPVANIIAIEKKHKPCKIVFIGRCEKSKGYTILPKIAEYLDKNDADFEWHIIGEKSLESISQNIWSKKNKVFFYGALNLEELYQILPTFDIIILPSLAEGMPVSIIEAMKAGLVPIVNDLESGLQQIIINGENGYRIHNNDPIKFAEIINHLKINNILFKKISLNAIVFANKYFDPDTNTKVINNLIYQTTHQNRMCSKKKIYGSFLDKNWLPNYIVLIIRNIILILRKIS